MSHMESPPPLPFPPARFYAVAQMDPLTMVKDLGLDDSETLRAVETLHPKKYLVYVNIVLDLPMPTSKWCRYCVKIVASTLCPEDRKHKILPDMVVPIFPNMQCSSDTRPPIRPRRDFPFNNCFHWLPMVSNTYIRTRRHTPAVDTSKAIRLDLDQNQATSWTFRQDYDRMNALPSQRDPDDSSPPATSSGDEFMVAVPDWALLDPVVREACSPIDFSEKRRLMAASERPQRDLKPSTPEPDLDSSSPSTSSCSIDDGDPKDEKRPESAINDKLDLTTSAAEVFMLNIFGWDPDPTFPLIPLVDLWFELEDHLTPENIPSPKEWFEEERKINAIIREAFARRHPAIGQNVPTTVSSMDESLTSTGEDSASSSTADSPSPHPDELQLPVSVKRDDSDTNSLRQKLDDATSSSRSRLQFSGIGVLRTLGTGLRRILWRTSNALCFRPRDDNGRSH